MDLSLRLNEHSRKEKCKSADGEDGGCDKLYDSFFHNIFKIYVAGVGIEPTTFRL